MSDRRKEALERNRKATVSKADARETVRRRIAGSAHPVLAMDSPDLTEGQLWRLFGEAMAHAGGAPLMSGSRELFAADLAAYYCGRINGPETGAALYDRLMDLIRDDRDGMAACLLDKYIGSAARRTAF